MIGRRYFLAGAAASLVPRALRADEALALLAEPGVHAIMRHAKAPGISDPSIFVLDDCATQRNLNWQGRVQASRTGHALRDAGVKIDRVLTSQWCRCRETAKLLGLGPTEDAPALNSYYEARQRRIRQTAALRQVIEAAKGETLMMVTHQVNISGLLALATASAEIRVFRLTGSGAEALGSFLIAA